MYTAIQARNIAAEKLNHKYYRVYKRLVRAIMRRLTYHVNHGDMNLCFFAKRNSQIEVDVLNQIADELSQTNYHCSVHSKEVEGTDDKIWFIVIQWDEET